jgi:dTDP-4-amino-4,6-dideoxygalactose transaminase
MHDFYKEAFQNKEGIKLFSEPTSDYFSNHWLSAITIDSAKCNRKTREDLRLLLESENIESRPLWKPMHLQPIFSESPYYGGNVSENLFNNGLCLPSGSNIDANEKDRIKNALNNF